MLLNSNIIRLYERGGTVSTNLSKGAERDRPTHTAPTVPSDPSDQAQQAQLLHAKALITYPPLLTRRHPPAVAPDHLALIAPLRLQACSERVLFLPLSSVSFVLLAHGLRDLKIPWLTLMITSFMRPPPTQLQETGPRPSGQHRFIEAHRTGEIGSYGSSPPASLVMAEPLSFFPHICHQAATGRGHCRRRGGG